MKLDDPPAFVRLMKTAKVPDSVAPKFLGLIKAAKTKRKPS